MKIKVHNTLLEFANSIRSFSLDRLWRGKYLFFFPYLCLAIMIAMGFPFQGVLKYHVRPALRSLVC
jgi:hypothetical protein